MNTAQVSPPYVKHIITVCIIIVNCIVLQKTSHVIRRTSNERGISIINVGIPCYCSPRALCTLSMSENVNVKRGIRITIVFRPYCHWLQFILLFMEDLILHTMTFFKESIMQ